MKREWERLTCFWRSRGGLQHGDFVLVCVWVPPFVFLLFRWWWRSWLAAWVLPFSDLQGGIEETVMLMLVFLGFFVCVFSVFFGSMYFLSLCFAGFLPSVLLCFFFSFGRSPLLSLYRASGNLGGGNGCPPKCSVIDAFNEENVRSGCQRTKRLCLYWQNRGRVKRRWTVVAKWPRFAGCEFAPCNSSNFAIKPLVKI